MNGEEAKKRGNDDTIFIKINQFITLKEEHISRNNVLLDEVLKKIIAIMTDKDPLFAELYQNMMFAGSFYKGTKVGHPEEFDVDLILKLPVDYTKIKFEEDRPGYAKIRVPENALLSAWNNHASTLNKWIANASKFLNNDELRKWFESVVTRSFSTLERLDDGWYKLITNSARTFKVKTKKSGPAFTLKVIADDVKFDIDLVPVLEFKIKPGLRALKKVQDVDRGWYLVPKPLKAGQNPELSWRFCFYPHEKKLLRSHGKIKPVIRHLKKLRDRQNWSPLASYYIETLIYNELDNDLNLNRSSMSMLLVLMLTKLKEACSRHEIPYYWDSRNNLLAERKPEQLIGLVHRMDRIIQDLQTKPSQTLHYFLTPEELVELNAAGTPPVTPSSAELPDDSGVWLPVAEASGVKKKLSISFSLKNVQEKTNQTPEKNDETLNDNQSMDQVAILTKTIAALTDEISKMKKAFTEEIRLLKTSMDQLTEQTNTMSEIIGLLLRKEIREANGIN